MKPTCPYCRTTRKQVRNGKNASGSSRRKCNFCGSSYTPKRQRIGYDKRKIDAVLTTYLGLLLEIYPLPENGELFIVRPKQDRLFRIVARLRKVNHQTACNWINEWLDSGKTIKEYLKAK